MIKNSLQNLDTVLNTIDKKSPYQNDSITPHLTWGDLIVELNKLNLSLTNQDVVLIIEKLKSDNHVKEVNSLQVQYPSAPFAIPDEHTGYSITFNGRYFLETIGGYEKEAAFLRERKAFEDSFLVHSEVNAKLLNSLTLFLGIGTISLVLIELVKFLYEVCVLPH